MITLDQVQLLEKKIEEIISMMNNLQKQNSALQEKNRELIEKNSLLMQRISSFEADQNRIEQGILNALDRLNSMENSALKVGTSVAQEQNTQEVINSTEESSSNVNFTEEQSQPNELTNFSNIQTENLVQEQEVSQQETQQNLEQHGYQNQEQAINFSDDKLDEESNNSFESENRHPVEMGLNFDFDNSVQDDDSQAQLGIF